MTPAQVVFWEGAFQRLMSTPEWQKEVESAQAVSTCLGSAKTREFMERDYVFQKALLTDLGLVVRK